MSTPTLVPKTTRRVTSPTGWAEGERNPTSFRRGTQGVGTNGSGSSPHPAVDVDQIPVHVVAGRCVTDVQGAESGVVTQLQLVPAEEDRVLGYRRPSPFLPE